MEQVIMMIIIPILVLFLLNLFLKRPNRHSKRSIPGPWNLPIIGSLHHLLSSEPTQRTLRRLASVHGPIMRIKLGQIESVVLSSTAAAAEIMKSNDRFFATRPKTFSANALSYGCKDIAIAPYSDYWRQMRLICLTELLGTKRVRSYRAVREEEVSKLVRFVAASAEEGAAVDLSEKFLQLSNNIACLAAAGKKFEDQEPFLSVLVEAVDLISGFTVVDLFPSLPIIARITGTSTYFDLLDSSTPIFSGFQRKLEQCCAKIDRITEKIIKEHTNKKDDDSFVEEDIVDVLLRIQKDGSLQFPITNDNIKAIILDMLAAGTETTATTIEWVMIELIQNPRVMRKVQKEVRDAFGSAMPNIIVQEEVMSSVNLPYLQLVIKEALRLHPPVPLLHRQNQESCKVMGYEIPAKVTFLVNIWAIGRDASYWDEPHLFFPERFEKDDVDFKGGQLKYLPFGTGRRICPGTNFGVATVELVLTNLLYYFDWKFVGKTGEELDMTETFGATVKKKFPLCLLPIQHIPLHEDSLSKI